MGLLDGPGQLFAGYLSAWKKIIFAHILQHNFILCQDAALGMSRGGVIWLDLIGWGDRKVSVGYLTLPVT